MSLVGRIFVIIFAVILASMAAGVAIAVGILGPQWHSMSGDPVERVFFWGTAFVGATGTGALGILPMIILIALAEAFNIRSLALNMLGGVAMLLLSYYGAGFAPPSYEESIDRSPPIVSHDLQIAAAAGAVFGLMYWLIAGRNAGRWRERSPQ
ncbi:hypothetical protein ASD45_18480 [Pseudolabrys sp. Root1462]|jgi:hypothetical protein|uniref:hypothetical protein n=1 Tax=Pseudolabrys sp. Root1462 TaxID=1736466 RepID=UPI000703A46E|nr:hypothetical protein [Pseudolabrys sp. Root1462]KQY97973.1 hypothetical protein ASD45_18480 [Pseudolabrys sp. Root1462]